MAAPTAARPSAMPPPILGLVPVTIATRSLSFIGLPSVRRRDQERLGRVEYPGVDEPRLLGLALELAHGAREAHPVQDLLLAAVLDGAARVAAPGLPAPAPYPLSQPPSRPHSPPHA